MRQLRVAPDEFAQSVHGKRSCVECHEDITKTPHQKNVDRKVGCVRCHRDLWDAAQREGKTAQFARLGVVAKQIDSYMRSIHARPNIDDQSRTNATCYNCHNAHYVYPVGSKGRAEFRLKIPDVCGKCHSTQRDEYLTSVHGKEVSQNANPKAAVCIDCHTTHDIESPKNDSAKLVITQNCGNCHSDELKTYTATYHGQVRHSGLCLYGKVL